MIHTWWRTSRWLLVLLALHSMPALHAAPEPTPISFSQALRMAGANHPRMAAAAAAHEGSQARIAQARSGFWPQLTLSETYNRTTSPLWAFGTALNQETITAADFNPARLNDPDAATNFATAVTMEWSLFDGGQTRLGLNQAELGERAAASTAMRTQQEVLAHAAAAFLNLDLAQRGLEVARQTLETARAHQEWIAARLAAGMTVESDLLQAQVRVAELERQRYQAESRIETCQAALSAALGQPADQRWELTGLSVEPQPLSGTVESWTAAALENRPDLQQLQHQSDIAQAEVDKSRATHLPTLSMLGSYELNSERFDESAENYTIGAVLRLNLFSGGRLAARTRESLAQRRQIEAERAELATGIAVQVRQALFDAQSAWQGIRVARGAVEQAEEALRIVARRYQNQLVPIVSLLDAQSTLQQSRLGYWQARHGYAAARVRLALATATIDADLAGP